MCKVTFSIWDKGTLITEYQLDLEEKSIQETQMDAASIWDEYSVVAEWGDGEYSVIGPYTYSKSLMS